MARLALLISGLFLWLAAAGALAQEKPSFEEWLQDLRTEVLAAGVSEASVNLAFSEITPPVQRIIQADRSQPETVQTYADYLDARVSDWKISNGRDRIEIHAALLDEIAREYGVQARFIVAFWGMETNFGTYPITESLFNVLATLAYDNRRGEMFRAQFIEAAKLLDTGFPGYENMKSSWAGAMGQVQFMPDTYLRYAVDHDGDGRRDIWHSDADVFASIANLLRSVGWDDSQTWGRKVKLPPNGETLLAAPQSDGITPDRYCRNYSSMGAWRDLQQWQALGVRQADGTDLPGRSMAAALVMADKGDGEAWLVYRNFCSIMRYNPAFKYALSIGLLSDQYQDAE
jgi:membrane-bound lytic murein transglycosylase B